MIRMVSVLAPRHLDAMTVQRCTSGRCSCSRNYSSQHPARCNSQSPRVSHHPPQPLFQSTWIVPWVIHTANQSPISGILAPIDDQRADIPRVLWSPSVISAASEPGAGGTPTRWSPANQLSLPCRRRLHTTDTSCRHLYFRLPAAAGIDLDHLLERQRSHPLRDSFCGTPGSWH